LGAELSLNKTHVSPDTYEFAKRWIQGSREITGTPMTGIVENISNPFIVFSNLYDFYKIKKNYYGSNLGLVSLLIYLYKGLNKNLSIKFSNSRFRARIHIFQMSLDIIFGYSTYDSLREFMAVNLTNDLYMIPGPELIHQEIDGVAGKGLGYTVKKGISKIYNIFKDLEKQNFLELEMLEFKETPIFEGIYNYIERYKETCQK